MDKKIRKRENMFCLCCMETHEVQTVIVTNTTSFKGVWVAYPAEYFYCDRAEEYYADENMTTANDIRMKNEYRKAVGLLTSEEIVGIREKYGISQSDLCHLLGWGAKTITRYEGHQVQDIAHDTILRKLAGDPEWFLSLLNMAKETVSPAAHSRYREKAIALFEENQDSYLRKAIRAKYARFCEKPSCSGNVKLSLNAVVDVIRYFSNAVQVTDLYKVKLMKLLWYSDALSYKRRGHAITGLVYQALPMGAVPIGHDSIIDLHGIEYEEIVMGEGTGYHFKETADKEYPYLSKEDISILEEIVRIFGKYTRDEIVETMHRECAYVETAPRDIIDFRYAESLSVD